MIKELEEESRRLQAESEEATQYIRDNVHFMLYTITSEVLCHMMVDRGITNVREDKRKSLVVEDLRQLARRLPLSCGSLPSLASADQVSNSDTAAHTNKGNAVDASIFVELQMVLVCYDLEKLATAIRLQRVYFKLFPELLQDEKLRFSIGVVNSVEHLVPAIQKYLEAEN